MDEYNTGSSGSTDEFEATAAFESFGKFIGIFLGSFLLGCAMGLATALVSSPSHLLMLLT